MADAERQQLSSLISHACHTDCHNHLKHVACQQQAAEELCNRTTISSLTEILVSRKPETTVAQCCKTKAGESITSTDFIMKDWTGYLETNFALHNSVKVE